MNADEMVEAAIAGFELGETITIPSLPDVADWEEYEAARQRMIPNLLRAEPAERYLTPTFRDKVRFTSSLEA